MDENGDLDWQRSFGGSDSDLLQSVKNTRDGGFILAGTSASMESGEKKDDGYGLGDYWIIKLNAEGGEEWQKTIGGAGNDEMNEIHQTPDGGFIIGGSTNSGKSEYKREDSFGSLDFWIVKLSEHGKIEWERSFGGTYMDQLESILPTTDEGYIIGGYSNSPQSGNKNEDSNGEGDFWVLKLDKFGDVTWQRTLGGEDDDHLYQLIESKNGGYILGGASRSGATGTKKKSNGKGSDYWVVKLDTSGEVEWENTYDFGKNDILISITENRDGTLLIGGHAKTETTGQKASDKKGVNDYTALKIDADGEEKWRKSVGSKGEDVLRRLVQTRDGGYVLAGTSKGKVSRDKNTGQGRGDFWVVKLMDEDKDDENERFLGLESFPNPTENFTNIIVNHEFEEGDATVYDLTGKQVQHFSISNRTVPINLHGLPVGVYVVTISTDVSTESVKVLKSN